MTVGREILQPVDTMMGMGEDQQRRVPSDYVEEVEEVFCLFVCFIDSRLGNFSAIR
jgi:hypothetical protein